jgi:hypothetical protein
VSNQNNRNRHENASSNSTSNDHYDNENDTAAPSVSSSWRKPKRYPRDSVNGDQDDSSRQSHSESYYANGYNEADAAANFKNAEADLLLDMQSAQAYAYDTPSTTEVGTFSHNSGRDSGGSALHLLSSGGGDGDTPSAVLNVSAMAAALSQLPLSQRFRIPRHLAATLVIHGEDDYDEDAEGDGKEETEAFHEYEVESVPSSTRDTVAPLTPLAVTPPVRANIPINSSESMSMLAGVSKASEQRENYRRDNAAHQDDLSAHPPRELEVAAPVDVSTPTANARRRNHSQRASVTSPIDLMSDNDDDNQGEYDDDDDPITRLRGREMLGSPSREGDARASVSSTANATAPTIAANTNNTSSTAAIIDCTGAGGEEDVDMWLDKALAGSETFETEHAEGEEQLDDWLDGVIE